MKITVFCLTLLITLALSACEKGPAAEKGDNSKTAAAPGKCIVTPPTEPMMCTMDWRPVCGCDGTTYSNPCSAKAAGVPEFTEGECKGEKLD